MKTKFFFLALCPILAALSLIKAAPPTASPKATSSAPPRPTPTSAPLSDEEQIRRIEKEWLDAILKRNGEYLEKLEAPDFQVTGPSGRTLNKDEDIKETTSGEMVFEKMKIEQLKVRLYGDTAIANGVANVTTRTKGEEETGRYAWTDVFTKMNGEWKAISAQVTAYPSREK